MGFGKAFLVTGQNAIMAEPLTISHCVAPEVFAGSYGSKCDAWSCGVIIYFLLFGKAPFNYFDGENELSLKARIQFIEINYNTKQWANVSPEVRDLLKRLLDKNTVTRRHIVEALEHKWFTDYTSSLVNNDGKQYETLCAIDNIREFQKKTQT